VVLRGGETVRIGDTELYISRREPTSTATTLAMSFGRMLGASPEMRRLYPLCERLANADVSVLIEGEGGTGKELLAESIHRASSRRDGAFVVFDCTAIPPNQIEAALFGESVTAPDREPGAVEQASDGTLFLDEVAELDPTVQAKLLRVLERSVNLGSSSERAVIDSQLPGSGRAANVRVIASTRRDIEKEIQAGRFRDDFFFRLAVGRIELPPLRKRAGDVKFLAKYFWKHLGGANTPVPSSLVARFESYAWPGNIRELRNAVMRRIALGDLVQQNEIGMKDHAGQGEELDPIERVVALGLPLSQSRDLIVEEFERRYLSKQLARHEGNATNAAKAAGVARRYFQLLRSRRGA
jgi:DNA-binding NtrC family response regulator